MRRMTRLGLFLALVLLAGTLAAQSGRSTKRRAELPKFDGSKTRHLFYDNLFAESGPLEGGRPSIGTITANNVAGPAASGTSGAAAEPASGGYAWSQVISRATVEDEIKSLNLAIQENVTTPGKFAGSGHKVARKDFTLTAILFGIAGEYDQDIRWKKESPSVRDLFARAASNTKAGGSSQVYAEAKSRRDDLNDLVRGSNVELRDAPVKADWSAVADRSPLMRLLQDRFSPFLQQTTANPAAFTKDLDKLRHEAELVAALAEVLGKESMEDVGDEDYDNFVKQMKQGALDVVSAVKLKNAEQARLAVGKITQACSECHEIYQ